MAERALLARQRDDGNYDLQWSRWGGTDRRLAAVCAGLSPAAVSDRWKPCGERGSFAGLVGGLDYLSTAVLYRERGHTTTVFLPLWFGLPLADSRPSPGAGALVSVDSLFDARIVRSEFRQLKGTLADAIPARQLPIAAAPFVLLSTVAGFDARERHVSPPFANI